MMEMDDALGVAVLSLDAKALRTLIDSGYTIPQRTQFSGSVLLDLLHVKDPVALAACTQRRGIIHMLTNAGLDVNAQDEMGNTALHLVVTETCGDPEIAEPLLQAGADLFRPNKLNQTALQLARTSPTVPPKVTDLLNKYSPGLWAAVEADDLQNVRKLVNMWCRVDISRNGTTLQTKALNMGTEHIIRLIKEIEPSMRFAHAVLAEDIIRGEKLLSSKENINLEFKNLGDMGATPLFYAIHQNNTAMVKLLTRHGARPDALITLEDEEIPILFAALHAETDSDLIKYLIPPRNKGVVELASLRYRGRHVLLHCVESGVGVAAVRHILQEGYSELVALRDQHNECARDLAVRLGKMDYVAIIDEVVYEWYLDVSGEHRRVLALMGYPYLRDATKDGVRAGEVVQSMETSSAQAQFDTQLHLYQEQKERFVVAVVGGHLDQVKATVTFTSGNPHCFQSCLADCRANGDGQPPLHKALLHGHLDVLEFLVQVIVNTLKKKMDDVRDQCLRSVLHYAYAMPRARKLVNLLLDYGASEFTMDKDCRSPLVFKDFQGHPLMTKLLAWHRDQRYSEPEPDPWSKRIPPILRIPVLPDGITGHHQPGCPSQMSTVASQAKSGHYEQTSAAHRTDNPSQTSWMAYCSIL